MTLLTASSNSGSSPEYPPAFIASDTTFATLSQRDWAAFVIASSINCRPAGPRDSAKPRSLSLAAVGNSQSSGIALSAQRPVVQQRTPRSRSSVARARGAAGVSPRRRGISPPSLSSCGVLLLQRLVGQRLLADDR